MDKISKDGRFLLPRRFSEVMQMDAEHPGTIEQQWSIRRVLAVEYGSLRHQLMKALDKSANQIWKRSYLTVGFLPDDMWPPHMNAVAGVSGMNMRAGFVEQGIMTIAPHELFHIVDKHLLNAEKRLRFMERMGIDPNLNTWNHNVQETWADAGRDWFTSGGISFGWIADLLPLIPL